MRDGNTPPGFRLVMRHLVYSEVEPFEGWKPNALWFTRGNTQLSIARSNPLRDGNATIFAEMISPFVVYSEVEPFEGWKQHTVRTFPP